MRRQLLWLLLVAGCRPGGGSPDSAGGSLRVQWEGSSRGRFEAPATALWCSRDTLLEILALRHDTAVGIALIAKDSLVPGHYSVFSAEVFTPFRPQANLALRWVTPVELVGYESRSGRVTVSATGSPGVSGQFEALLQRHTGGDSIRLSGDFRGLRVGPAIPACGRANRPGAR
jgi:hypothetical protein